MVTTCVAAACDPPDRAAETGKRDLGPNERMALEALATALVDGGREPPLALDIPRSATTVTLAEWREKIIRYQPDDRPMKRRTEAADRAMRSLVAGHRVMCVEGNVWLPPGRTGRARPHEAPCGYAAGPGPRPHGPHGSLDMRPCGRAAVLGRRSDRGRGENRGIAWAWGKFRPCRSDAGSSRGRVQVA